MPRRHALDRSSSSTAPRGWSGRLKPRPPRRTLAEDGHPRNGAQLASLAGAPARLASAPTRCSCTMHCKEQARNNGIGSAKVSYSPRLVRSGAGGLRDFSAFARLKRAWFGSPCLVFKKAHLADARARKQKLAAASHGPVGATLVNTLFSKILATRVNRKIRGANGSRTWQQRCRGDGVARPQRRHSMATNSSRAEVPLVVGTAPAISSRSTLWNEAASM